MTGENLRDGKLERLPIELLHPNPYQPRRRAGEANIESLAESFIESGMQSPIVVSPHFMKDGEFYIVQGERRWRAAQMAMWESVECKILLVPLNEEQLSSDAYIENTKREDMNPLDRAYHFKRAVTPVEEGGLGLTIEKAARINQEPRSTVNNLLRLLKLPVEVQNFIDTGQLSYSLAKHIAGLPDQFKLRIAKAAVKDGWSLKQLESNTQYISSLGKKGKKKLSSSKKGADILTVERLVSERIGSQASITTRNGKVKFEAQFHSTEEFQGFLEALGVDVNK